VNRRVVKDDGSLSESLNMQKEGAVHLLRNDPLTQGPKLFGRHCASCHDYRPDGEGYEGPTFATLQSPKVDEKGQVVRDDQGNPVYEDTVAGAPNLYGFGSVRWIEHLLDHEAWKHSEFGAPVASTDPNVAADKENPDNYKRPAIADYFGNTAHKDGDMAGWLESDGEELLYETKDGKRTPKPERHKIAVALAAQAQRPTRPGEAAFDKQDIAEGIALIQENCTGCHRFGDQGDLGSAPDLTGYGSYEWMMGLVSDPTNERFYRDTNDRMPCFALDLEHPERNNISPREISLIVDWLRGQYYKDEDGHRHMPHDEETARRKMEDARRVKFPEPKLVTGE
jgi:ubiquinol-cytochrome c reductase cytochrome b subunit